MPILGVEGDTMVSVPRVRRVPVGVGRDTAGLAEGRLGVMSLSGSRSIDCSQIDNPTGLTRFLPDNVHSAAPGCRGIQRNTFQNTELYIAL